MPDRPLPLLLVLAVAVANPPSWLSAFFPTDPSPAEVAAAIPTP